MCPATRRVGASGGVVAKRRVYADGEAEVSWGFASKGRRQGTRGESKARAANEERASRRARAEVRRIVQANRLDHLLTCTFRENLEEEPAAWRVWLRFVHLVREELPGWSCVVLAERQERGAIHFHAGVRGWQKVKVLRRCWLEASGRYGGNVDVKSPRRGWEPWRLGQYLAKYLGKDVDQDRKLNRRRFRTYGRLERVAVQRQIWTRTREPAECVGFALTWLREVSQRAAVVLVEEERPLAGWMATWGD